MPVWKLAYGTWSTYHVTGSLGPINTWTIPDTTQDVVSFSSTDTISLNGKGGHYETCYKAFSVSRSGQYTISYDYNLPTINFYGTDSKWMHFGIFISTVQPPGGNMSSYSDYTSGNCNGYEICGPSSQYNTPGTGHAEFTYQLTAGTTYYLWIPMMELADGVQTYLTFTNIEWIESAESKVFNRIGILTSPDRSHHLAYVEVEPDPSELLEQFYPVGTYYTTMDPTFDPNVTFVGTWVKDTDGRVTVATNGSDVGTTGGEETHTITTSEMPAHTHTTRIGSVSPWTASKAPDQSSLTSTWSRAYGNGTIGSYPRCSMYGTATFSCSKNGDNHNNIMPSKIAIRWHRTA